MTCGRTLEEVGEEPCSGGTAFQAEGAACAKALRRGLPGLSEGAEETRVAGEERGRVRVRGGEGGEVGRRLCRAGGLPGGLLGGGTCPGSGVPSTLCLLCGAPDLCW